MKKNVFVIFLLLLGILSCFSIDKENNSLSKLEIQRNMYPFGGNWDELTKNGDRIFLYYKTNFRKTVEYICEFCYAIENNNEIKIVGGYNKKSGFYDVNGKTIIGRAGSDTKSDFWNKYLIGISLSLLEDPFVINGVALDSCGKTVYETEVMEMFTISSSTRSLKEWYPTW